MDAEEFQEKAEELIDYIVDYLESVSERRVVPDVSPGYLKDLLPSTPPKTGESFDKIMEDFEAFIMSGITHWQHPRFHAYFPSSCSYPAILAEMLSDTIGCVGFNWNISPSGTELETIMLDWYGKMIGLPKKFLRYANGSRGGGVIQNSSSECILVSMLTARNDVLNKLQKENPSLTKAALLSSLVAYCSKESHSCVEKAALIALVTIKILETDEEYRLRGKTLEEAVTTDKKNGLIPFFISITLGTTSCCSCDPIDEIGRVCEENDIWLNVDGAYGGTAMMCPEFYHLLNGIEYASTFNVNPAKWMMVNLDCAVMWVNDRYKINDSLVVDKTHLGFSFTEKDWGHPSNRRFRALKLWFVIRTYGIEGLQKHIRNHVRLAKMFEKLVRSDNRFEVLASQFGLVCFRLKGNNSLNKKMLMSINSSAKLHIIACNLNGKYTIRFCVCAEKAKDDDIVYAWNVFSEFATELLQKKNEQ